MNKIRSLNFSIMPAAIALSLCPAAADAATCTADTAGINFGSYDPLESVDTKSVGNIRVDCDGDVAAVIALTAGNGTYAARVMSNGRSDLKYNLYSDPAWTTVWGDGTAGSQSVSVSDQAAEVPFYGIIPAQQNVTAGAYSDELIVTVTF